MGESRESRLVRERRRYVPKPLPPSEQHFAVRFDESGRIVCDCGRPFVSVVDLERHVGREKGSLR